MRVLPEAVGVDVEPARQGITDINERIAPVKFDVEDLLDKRVRVAGLDAGPGQKAELRCHVDTDLRLPEISSHDRFSPVLVVVARADILHQRRYGPAVVSETKARG